MKESSIANRTGDLDGKPGIAPGTRQLEALRKLSVLASEADVSPEDFGKAIRLSVKEGLVNEGVGQSLIERAAFLKRVFKEGIE